MHERSLGTICSWSVQNEPLICASRPDHARTKSFVQLFGTVQKMRDLVLQYKHVRGIAFHPEEIDLRGCNSRPEASDFQAHDRGSRRRRRGPTRNCHAICVFVFGGAESVPSNTVRERVVDLDFALGCGFTIAVPRSPVVARFASLLLSPPAKTSPHGLSPCGTLRLHHVLDQVILCSSIVRAHFLSNTERVETDLNRSMACR